ncbi:uncharacterized protein LOC132731277 [Ruditapes philippinarum]|uniref:uncharacterized protein LOC132731277 n=1 Tax=Ruditapes philippinarum TaxID=129788 RepID=UPI00295B5AC7|nr:uncharacterized protein LOC132731277 [Ruditapes philippinarum]
MKSLDSSFVRIAEGGDNCEQLARPSSINSNFIEKDFEYLEKSAFYRVFDQKTSFENSYNQIYQHYIYQEVKVGDKFHFVFQKSNTDRLTITFRDTTNTIQAVKFNDNSTQLVLTNVGLSGQNENEKLASPLQDFKIYKIRFEILQYHWKITVNDKVLPKINHHGLITNIEVIFVRLGPSIKYLSKYFNPRNQPTGITGW